MKNLFRIVIILVLSLNCESSKPIVISQANPSEHYVRNTEVWGDLKDLDSSEKYTTLGHFLNRKSKIQNLLISAILNIDNEEVDFLFIESNGLYNVPLAKFSLNDNSRHQLAECVGKYFEWDKIAIQNGDELNKEICSVAYYNGFFGNTGLPSAGQFKIFFFTDFPKKNDLRFDFGAYLNPENENETRKLDNYFLSKKEIIGLNNALTDKAIAKEVQAYIKKKRATQSRYR